MSIETAFRPAAFPLIPAAAPHIPLALAVPQSDLFEKLTALITDASGNVTPERQLAAYVAFLTLHLNADADGAATATQLEAVAASVIGAQARRLQVRAALTIRQAVQSASDLGHAARAFYQSLPVFEENILFQTANIKLPLRPLPMPSSTVIPLRKGQADTTPRRDPFLLFALTMLELFVDCPLPAAHNTARPSMAIASAAA